MYFEVFRDMRKIKEIMVCVFSGLFQCLNEVSFGTILEKTKAYFY